MSCHTAWAVLERCTPAPAIETVFERSVDGKIVGRVKRVRTLSLIEPTGYVLTPWGLPIEDSLSFNDAAAADPFQLGLPAPKAWKHLRQRMRTYDTVVSFRHYFENNYYHFLMDMLGGLELLDASGLGDLPIVVGAQGARTGYGSDLLKTGDLASRNWIVQDDEYLRAESVVYLQTFQQGRLRADHLLDLMNVPIPSDQDGDRLYLSRPPGVGRSILNTAEVAEVLEKYGFREVVLDDLAVQEQIRLFHGARYVVGTHGAGLTNIIYRRGAPLGVLELHGHTWLGRLYGDLCGEYGYYHDRLPCVGEAGTVPWRLSGFSVDIPQLDRSVRRMLGEA
jgi:hypothetical protein